MAGSNGEQARKGRAATGTELLVAGVVAAGCFGIQLIVSRTTADTFRLPKELAFRAEAVLLLACAVFWATSRRRTWRLTPRADFLLAAVALIWTSITVLTAVNRAVSVDSLITVVAAVIIYIASGLAAQTIGLPLVDAAVTGSCINAVIVILQELKIWNPMTFGEDIPPHMRSSALIGNPNDVGVTLLLPAVAAVAMVAATRGRRRWIYCGAALLLLGGMAASATRTAIIAMAAGVLLMAVQRSWRSAIAALLLVTLAGIAAWRSDTSLGLNIRLIQKGVQERRLDILFSERLPAFLAAIDMLRDHPLTGVGPGGYKFLYMPYRIALEKRYPAEWVVGWRQNFGQTHNDHLQVAAEGGLPAYALFLSGFCVAVTAVWRNRRRNAEAVSETEAFARVFLAPAAASVFVVCAAQFPLQIAAPRVILLTLTAASLTWISSHA